MRLMITISMFLYLSACSLSANKAPEKRFYRFDESLLQQTNKTPSLDVKRPSAMGIIGNRPMVAQNVDGSLLQMQHSFWLESPKILLHNYLIKVFNKKPQTYTKSTLNTQILELEKKQQLAIVALKFIVTDETNQITFNKTYRLERALKENTISAFVDAVSVLLKEIINQLRSDMS